MKDSRKERWILYLYLISSSPFFHQHFLSCCKNYFYKYRLYAHKILKITPVCGLFIMDLPYQKMLLTYHFEVLSDFNYFLLANMLYLRYEKPEIRPQKDMHTYSGTKFKFRCQINIDLIFTI